MKRRMQASLWFLKRQMLIKNTRLWISNEVKELWNIYRWHAKSELNIESYCVMVHCDVSQESRFDNSTSAVQTLKSNRLSCKMLKWTDPLERVGWPMLLLIVLLWNMLIRLLLIMRRTPRMALIHISPFSLLDRDIMPNASWILLMMLFRHIVSMLPRLQTRMFLRHCTLLLHMCRSCISISSLPCLILSSRIVLGIGRSRGLLLLNRRENIWLGTYGWRRWLYLHLLWAIQWLLQRSMWCSILDIALRTFTSALILLMCLWCNIIRLLGCLILIQCCSLLCFTAGLSCRF